MEITWIFSWIKFVGFFNPMAKNRQKPVILFRRNDQNLVLLLIFWPVGIDHFHICGWQVQILDCATTSNISGNRVDNLLEVVLEVNLLITEEPVGHKDSNLLFLVEHNVGFYFIIITDWNRNRVHRDSLHLNWPTKVPGFTHKKLGCLWRINIVPSCRHVCARYFKAQVATQIVQARYRTSNEASVHCLWVCNRCQFDAVVSRLTLNDISDKGLHTYDSRIVFIDEKYIIAIFFCVE